MKKILIAFSALAMGTAAASAADLPVYRSAPPPAVVAPLYNWSGFYIGLNGGGGSANTCWDFLGDAFGDFPGPEGCHNATGGTFGGQIGYRWQAANWVFGVEGQGNWADFKGNNVSLLFSPNLNQSQVNSFGLLTGQIGYAWNNVLFFVKGGAAVTGNRYDAFSSAGGVPLASASESRWGGTLGAGIEFGFARDWSLGVEYDHLFMGTRNLNFTDPTGAFFQTESIRQDVDIGLVRLNYRFGGWGAPMTARY